MQLLIDVVVFVPRLSIPIEARGTKQRMLLRYLLAENLIEALQVVPTRGGVDLDSSLAGEKELLSALA